jgi:hypothetical protein
VDGPLHAAAEVGVVQDDEGVLAPELHGAPDQAGGALLGHRPADPGRPGEHDVVGVVDERGAQLGARPGHHPDERGVDPGLVEERGRPEGGVGGLVVGLDHDAVAGEKGGQGVGDAEDERVVPRDDEADHPERPVVLGRAGEDR